MIKRIFTILFLSHAVCASHNHETAKSALLSRLNNIKDLYVIILGYLDKYDNVVNIDSDTIEKYLNNAPIFCQNSISATDALSPDKRFLATRNLQSQMIVGLFMQDPQICKSLTCDLENLHSLENDDDNIAIKIFDLTTLQKVISLRHGEKIDSSSAHKYAHRIINNRIVGVLAHAIGTITYSADGKYIASCSNNGIVKLWDAKKHTLLETYCESKEEHHPPIDNNTVSFSLDGRYLIFGNLYQKKSTVIENQAVSIELDDAAWRKSQE